MHAPSGDVEGGGAGDLQVARRELRVPPVVTGTDVLAVFVLDRIWEAGVQVIHRENVQLPRTSNDGPDQEAVRGVKKQTPSAIRLNHRLRIVANEEERVVEIAVSPRTNIRCIHRGARNPVASCDL